MEHIC